MAIDKFVKEVWEKDLTTTIRRRYGDQSSNSYSNFFSAQDLHIQGPDQHEPERIQQLRPLLEDLCRHMSSNSATSSDCEKQALSDEAIDQSFRQHIKEIGHRLKAADPWRTEKDWKPEPANEMLLNAPSVTTLSAIDDWSSTPEIPPSLQSLSQKVLMNDLRQSLVGAKATAAFCCGASVAFREFTSQGSATYHTKIPPVTVRWDDQHQAYGKVVFSQASSGDPVFRKALEQLCHASQPASFGWGGETVLDGRWSFPAYISLPSLRLQCV